MKILLYFVLFSFSTNIYSQKISTINISFILESNNDYVVFLENLNIKKNILEQEIKNLDKLLQNDKFTIENSSPLINDTELDNMVSKFNLDLNNLENKINYLDIYINKNIQFNKKIIISKIAELSSLYSIDNNIDIIFNENNYFVALNSVDISKFIIKSLNEIKLSFKILNYE